MLWILKQKPNEIKLIGSCPCLKKRFFGIKMLRYCTFFFDIEHISSRIKLKNKINKNFLRINNKGIFAFLWIQKRKRNEIHFFSKGQKKRNVRSQKNRNVDIPSRDEFPALVINILYVINDTILLLTEAPQSLLTEY